MRFVNHTPFPALAFAGVDPRGESFHVVVLRQTLTWRASGELVFADSQQPLCEADETFDQTPPGGVRQESDLCPYKPRCDVIVNATAYPPRGRDGRRPGRFRVRLLVKRPDTPAPLPAEPDGLNPLMPASSEALGAWRQALDWARRTPIPGACQIDKTLTVTGARQFIKRPAWLRVMAALLKLGTLGLVRLSSWRLTQPRPAEPVAVRLDQAFGGQCRIDAGTRAADKIGPAQRLTPAQAAVHPDAAQPPVAHEADAANPAGQGFVRDGYLKALTMTVVPAPRIEYPDHPLTLKHFNRIRAGHIDAAKALVAGLGVRPKGHPDRAIRVGTIDEKFIESGAALPQDFDFAVWNAAWPDQQVEVLRGDEVIELTNLCAPDTPAADRDRQGNTILRLNLPGHRPFVWVRFENGAMGELEARLDTILIEPDQRRVGCVWRATVATRPEVRIAEARMIERRGPDAGTPTRGVPQLLEPMDG